MDWLVPLLGIGIGAAGSIYSANKQADAAKDAANIGAQTGKINQQLVGDVTSESLADYTAALGGSMEELYAGEQKSIDALQQGGQYSEPWRAAGQRSLNELTDAMNFNGQEGYDRAMGNFQTGPGYQFQMDQGTKALESGAAARGGIYSGGQGQALTRYGQGQANQEWANHLSRLSGLAGSGQTAAQTMGGFKGQESSTRGQSSVNRANTLLGSARDMGGARTMGLNYMTGANDQLANSRISGVTAPANAWNSGMNNLSQFAGNLFS